MEKEELYKFGNELQICGMVLGNALEHRVILFPEVKKDIHNIPGINITLVDDKTLREILFQLDVVECIGNQKVVLRKSQRQLSDQISWNVYRRDECKCRYCGDNKSSLSVDHIILWKNMGETVEDNLITACKKCNKTRGDMEYEDWLDSDYYKSVAKNLSISELLNNVNAYQKALSVPLRPTQRSSR